jgi:hypothetical protein
VKEEGLVLPHGPLAQLGRGDRGRAVSPGCGPLDAALTRRRLLTLAGAATTTAILWPSRLAAPATAAVPAADPYGRSRFVAHLGESFRISAPGGSAVSVRLDEIRDLTWTPSGSASDRENGFVLIFRGPSTPRLRQDVMRVAHAQLGTLDLLVSPAGAGRGGQDYAAVINRLAPPNQ